MKTKSPINKPTDTELIDALERFIKNDPLVLWYGGGPFPGKALYGLSLLNGKRSLREALDQLEKP